MTQVTASQASMVRDQRPSAASRASRRSPPGSCALFVESQAELSCVPRPFEFVFIRPAHPGRKERVVGDLLADRRDLPDLLAALVRKMADRPLGAVAFGGRKETGVGRGSRRSAPNFAKHRTRPLRPRA